MEESKSKQKGSYSNMYGFHVSHIRFDCGGVPMACAPHGTLSTAGIDKSNPKRYTSINIINKLPIELPRAKNERVPHVPRNPLGPSYIWPVESKEIQSGLIC